jgi:hypothetical protein
MQQGESGAFGGRLGHCPLKKRRLETHIAMDIPFIVLREYQAIHKCGHAGPTATRPPQGETKVFLSICPQKMSSRRLGDGLRHRYAIRSPAHWVSQSRQI